ESRCTSFPDVPRKEAPHAPVNYLHFDRPPIFVFLGRLTARVRHSLTDFVKLKGIVASCGPRGSAHDLEQSRSGHTEIQAVVRLGIVHDTNRGTRPGFEVGGS